MPMRPAAANLLASHDAGFSFAREIGLPAFRAAVGARSSDECPSWFLAAYHARFRHASRYLLCRIYEMPSHSDD